MSTNHVPIRPTAIRYGLIAGVTGFALGVIFNLAGINNSAAIAENPQAGSWAGWITWVILAAIIYFAMTQQKEKEGGYLTYGRAFRTGFGVSLVYALISVVAIFLMFNVIDPSYLEVLQTASMEQAMEQQGGELPPEAEEYMKMFMSSGAIAVFGFIGSLIGGMIISAIAGLIVRKDPPAGAGALDDVA